MREASRVVVGTRKGVEEQRCSGEMLWTGAEG